MVYYYPCFRWRIRDRSRSGISQALKSILQSSTSTQPSFPRFLQAGFYVIGGSQSLRRRTSRLPLWQHPYKYFIRKCRTLQDGFPAFFFLLLSSNRWQFFSYRFSYATVSRAACVLSPKILPLQAVFFGLRVLFLPIPPYARLPGIHILSRLSLGLSLTSESLHTALPPFLPQMPDVLSSLLLHLASCNAAK